MGFGMVCGSIARRLKKSRLNFCIARLFHVRTYIFHVILFSVTRGVLRLSDSKTNIQSVECFKTMLFCLQIFANGPGKA